MEERALPPSEEPEWVNAQPLTVEDSDESDEDSERESWEETVDEIISTAVEYVRTQIELERATAALDRLQSILPIKKQFIQEAKRRASQHRFERREQLCKEIIRDRSFLAKRLDKLKQARDEEQVRE